MILDCYSSFIDKEVNSRTRSIVWPWNRIDVSILFSFSLHPVNNSFSKHIVCMFRNFETCGVEVSPSAVYMVRASGSPASILLIFGGTLQYSSGVLFVLFNDFHLSLIAISKRTSRSTTNSKDIGKGPRIIERIDGEERNFDKGEDILGKHAFPGLRRIVVNTLSNWGSCAIVGDCHEIGDLCSVIVLLREVVSWIQENSTIWYWPYFCIFWCSVCNMICP